MSTQAHALLALFLCSTACLVLYSSSLRAIGLFFGPSAATNAIERQQSLQDELAAFKRRHGAAWPWNSAASAADEMICPSDGEDARFAIIRDAGAVAGLFALLLALAPKFSATVETTKQRLGFLLLSVPLCVLPGLVGQVVFERRVPHEFAVIQSWGLAKGVAYYVYCASKGLVGGLGSSSAITTLIHESQVVAIAGLLSFIVLGVTPSVK